MNEEALNSVSGEVAKYRGRVHSQKWNLADIEDIDRHVSEIEDRLGTIEILVNITGGPPQHLLQISQSICGRTVFARWSCQSSRSLTGCCLGCGCGDGANHHIGVLRVISPIPNLGLSNSLRLALVGWSKTLANEVAPTG